MKKILYLILFTGYRLSISAQAAYMDEAAEDAEGSNPIDAILGLLIFAGLLYIIRLIYNSFEHSQVNKRQLKFEKEYNIKKKKKETELRNNAKFEYVDLGLSVKWATFNLGAYKPNDLGSEFYWGENTSWYPGKDFNTIKDANKIGKITFNKAYDAATNMLGEHWHIPTETECKELMDKCIWERTTIDNVSCYKVTGINGNSIILPLTDQIENPYGKIFKYGIYWTSFPSFDSNFNKEAKDLRFGDAYNEGPIIGKSSTSLRRHIRPVYSQVISHDVNENDNNGATSILEKNGYFEESLYDGYRQSACLKKDEESGFLGVQFNEDIMLKDEYDVYYSKDGKRLLEAGKNKESIYKIKEGTEIICDYAFINKSYVIGGPTPQYIKKIILPTSLLYISESALPRNCEIESHSPYYIVLNTLLIDLRKKSIVKCLDEFIQEVTIPENIQIIEKSVFSHCKCLRKVSLSQSIRIIEDDAFYECEELQSINLPNPIVKIGNKAFYGCKKLNINCNTPCLIFLGDRAFYGCSKIEKIDIPSSIKFIGKRPFCSNVGQIKSHSIKYKIQDCFLIDESTNELIQLVEDKDSIRIPTNIESIGDDAFEGFNIVSLDVPSNIRTIGRGAFSYCERLERVNLPDGLQSIEDSLFFRCKSLRAISIPKSVLSIGWGAFSGCKALQNIELPENLNSVGDGAFGWCESLTSIALPQNLKKIGKFRPIEVFQYCTNLHHVLLQSIDLSECKLPEKIQKRDIGNSVNTVPSFYFSELYAEKITIPSNVIKIKTKAFFKCSNLRELTFLGDDIEFEPNWLTECKNVKKIYTSSNDLEFFKQKMNCPNNIEIIKYKRGLRHLFG